MSSYSSKMMGELNSEYIQLVLQTKKILLVWRHCSRFSCSVFKSFSPPFISDMTLLPAPGLWLLLSRVLRYWLWLENGEWLWSPELSWNVKSWRNRFIIIIVERTRMKKINDEWIEWMNQQVVRELLLLQWCLIFVLMLTLFVCLTSNLFIVNKDQISFPVWKLLS